MRLRRSSVTDPIGRTTSFAYDDAGRVTDQIRPDGRVTHFTYDANGNITSVSPPSRPQHGFAFTPENLTSSYTPPPVPSGGATQYAYNLDRQPISILRPDGKTISLGYDPGARLSTLSISRGMYKYDYNAAGQLDLITAPDGGKIALGYSGPLLTSAAWSGAVQASVGFAYDDDFRLTSETAAGVPVTFGYDSDGLLTSAGALTLQRDPLNGLLTGSTLASITDEWSYDTFGSPSSYTAAFSATPLFSEQLTRNDVGQITQKSESVAGATHTVTYGYDNVGRLTRAAPDTGDPVTYGYDDNGNRTSRSTSTSSETGSYDDQDRLLAYGAATFTYTSNGELATKTDASGPTGYNIDEMGNLLSVTLPAGTEIDYLIDGQNRRIAKTVAGTMTRQWIWSGPLRIAAELDGTGSLVSRFVYATHTNVPDYMVRGGVTYRIITDHLGSVRLVVDASTGTIAQRLDYDEFGRVLGDSSPGFQPFGFAGGMYDPDTGFVRFGARDYDSQVGRWTLKDPSGFGGGSANLYTYAASDPINMVDPDGLAVYPANFIGPLRPGDTREYAANLSDPRLVPLQYPAYGAAPGYYYPPGTPSGLQQECVSFTKTFSGAPCTACWQAGRSVAGNNIPSGTAIATFVNGRYPQGNVAKNSGIYLYPGPDGSIIIIDQWPGHPGQARQVNVGGANGRSNDANAYSTISAPAGECGCGSH